MTESESQIEKTTSMLETIQNYIFSKKGLYLAVAIALAVGIYFYMNQNKKEESKNDNNIENNQLPLPQPQLNQQQMMQQQMMQQQMMQQQMMQQQGMPQQGMPQQGMPQQGMPQQAVVNRPTQVEFAPELLADLKKQNITPEQYLYMLQQRGELPPGELPKVVDSAQKNMNQEQVVEDVNSLSDIHKIEDDEEDEDNNLRNQDLTNEEMESIKKKLEKLNYNQSRN